jgi:hypothetical protein
VGLNKRPFLGAAPSVFSLELDELTPWVENLCCRPDTEDRPSSDEHNQKASSSGHTHFCEHEEILPMNEG